ncbi:hypothetical protein [Pseudozobellia thermophila]|uniref:Uncharacterized protein n=1 Tax=Pseudozobellia thermophila TaxID=192903 RepID=A0A1M6IN29_9FLAO|nr:hypothetical protein [Pseudozobellia thermophila]SHJ35855.1 hypothetical protein SAMN04488513_10454 [Pseudozobellia thermophila]
MGANKTKYSYREWFSAEEMHEHSKKWFSELAFVKDEQHFLDQLIQSFAVKPITKEEFGHLSDFKKALAENQRTLTPLFRQVEKHMNQLEIMVDGVNQLEMEQAYQKTHQKLSAKTNEYLLNYRKIKEKGFGQLSSILKATKQKIPLGNPEYQLKTTGDDH